MITKIFLKLLLSTSISFVSSIISTTTTTSKIDIQSITIYLSAYFGSLVLTLILKRFFSNKITKNMKTTFFLILSILEIFLFFIIEFSTISYEQIAIHNIFNQSRIIFLLLRYLCVNKLLIFDFKKFGLMFIIYASNICGYFFIMIESITIEKFIVTFIGLISIIITLSIIQKPNNEEVYIELLRHLFKCFFLVKQEKNNNLIHIKGEILKLVSTVKANINLSQSHLNQLFLVEQSDLIANKFKPMNPLEKFQSLNEKYVDFDLDEFILKDLEKENKEEARIKVKIKSVLTQDFILSIKRITLRGDKYILFEVQESNLNAIHEFRETSQKENEKQQFLTQNLQNVKKLLVNSHISVEKLMIIGNLDEENIDQIKLLLSQLKLNTIKIDNLIILLFSNFDRSSRKLTKAKLNIFMKEILDFIIPIARLKKISFNFVIDEFLMNKIIKFDYEKLEIILLNLLIYSVKSTIPNSIINISITFNDENVKTIKFFIQDMGIEMDQIKLGELSSMIKKQDYSYIKLNKNFTNLLVSQRLLSFFGELNVLKISSKVGKGNSYEFSLQPSKISDEKRESPRKFSLIDMSKKDPLISSQKIPSNNLIKHFSNTECKSLSTFTKTDYSGKFSSKKITELSNCNLTLTKLDSSKKLNRYSSIILNQCGNNIDKAKCLCPQILVIYNNFFNGTIFKTILNSLKFKYFITENESKALAKLVLQNNCTDPNCQGFQLILIDCSTPISSCVSFIKKIKNLMNENVINTMPILGSIIFVSKDEISEYLNAGLTDFIPNPLNKNTIIDCIIKWTNLLQL